MRPCYGGDGDEMTLKWAVFATKQTFFGVDKIPGPVLFLKLLSEAIETRESISAFTMRDGEEFVRTQ